MLLKSVAVTILSRSGWPHRCVVSCHPGGAGTPALRVPAPSVSSPQTALIAHLLMTSGHCSYAQYQLLDSLAGKGRDNVEADRPRTLKWDCSIPQSILLMV